jgi:excisionase family DNA binding protein
MTMVSQQEADRQASMRWTATQLPRYIGITKFCQLADLSETAVREWIAEGKLPHVRFGRTIRIPITALKGF